MEREEVLGKLRERIVRFAASHLSRDVAEDLAQEVLMLLHEKYAHLESAEDLLPLSLQIVRFNPPPSQRFAPGDTVSVRLPHEGVQLLAKEEP